MSRLVDMFFGGVYLTESCMYNRALVDVAQLTAARPPQKQKMII